MANDEKAVSAEFPELFHYTNISAFENIYKTKEFWASHFKDLKDSTEFARFRLKVRDFIRPRIREIFNEKVRYNVEIATDVEIQGGIDNVVAMEAEWHLDTVYRHMFGQHMYKETFICSFCAHTDSYEANHGLLSQWRGYGADDRVAIVLDTAGIEKMMQHDYDIYQLQIMYIADVIYDDDETERIERRFHKVYENFPQVLDGCYNDEKPHDRAEIARLYGEMHDHFVLGSTLVKHHAFHEEKEIRIVVSPKIKDSYDPYDPRDPKLQKEIRYKQAENSEARYISLFGDSALPIKRIIIGPSRIQNFNYQRIKDMLSKDPSIDIVTSVTPFLG